MSRRGNRTLSPDTGAGAPADCSHNIETTMKNQTRGESPLSATPCSGSEFWSVERTREFESRVKPVIEWLRDNCNPHTTLIVTGEKAELLGGRAVVTLD